MSEKNDIEKRLSLLEDKVEFLIQPLLYDLAENALAPNRVGFGSVLLWWMRGRWEMEKREEAKKTLLAAAELLALNSPGAMIQRSRHRGRFTSGACSGYRWAAVSDLPRHTFLKNA